MLTVRRKKKKWVHTLSIDLSVTSSASLLLIVFLPVNSAVMLLLVYYRRVHVVPLIISNWMSFYHTNVAHSHAVQITINNLSSANLL